MDINGSVSDQEIPQFFLCPISLQIMKDPVTVETGITYDRDSIEQWLSSSLHNNKNKNNPSSPSSSSSSSYCPVTKQLLPHDSELTPNHTLRRLIQAWCTSKGVDRIPTPKSPLNKIHVLKLLQDLWLPDLRLKALKTLEALASEKESNKRCMAGAGVPHAIVSIIITCFKNDSIHCLKEALAVLNLIRVPVNEIKLLMAENHDFFDSITWAVMKSSSSSSIMHDHDHHKEMMSHAVSILKSMVEFASPNLLEILKPEFFESVLWVLRSSESKISSQEAIKSALHVLLLTSPCGRNRIKIIEAGAVSDLIELELSSPDKRTTELIFGVLDLLCSCADGRAKFLDHAAGLAMVSKRILRVSPTANDLAVRIFSSICKFSGTNEVVQEMLRVGAVSKLCMILQAESAGNVKEKAREVLRLHSNVWSNSPCIATYLLTRRSTCSALSCTVAFGFSFKCTSFITTLTLGIIFPWVSDGFSAKRQIKSLAVDFSTKVMALVVWARSPTKRAYHPGPTLLSIHYIDA